MLGDEPAGYKTLLVRVQFGHGPCLQSGIDQIGVHLAVRVHGRYRAVISYQSGIALLKEKAQISVLKPATVRTVGANVLREVEKGGPKLGEVSLLQPGDEGLVEGVRDAIRARGGVGHFWSKGVGLLKGERSRGAGGRRDVFDS